MKYKFTWLFTILIMLFGFRLMGQSTGSVTSHMGITMSSAMDILVDASETLLIGPGNYTITGTWNIYSKYVWIDPAANISGTGTINFYNPSNVMGAASATYIDGNNVTIDVNVELHNASNLVITDMIHTSPVMSWTDLPGNASLAVGKDFAFMVDNGDVILGNVFTQASIPVFFTSIGNTTITRTDFIFGDDATLSNYRPERMVVTSNSIQGHMVKSGISGSFVFPVGIAEGDYTPVEISVPDPEAPVYVSVQDYAASLSDESTDPAGFGIDRTWHIYSPGGATTWDINLQHNTNSQQTGFDEITHSVSQWNGVDWPAAAPSPILPGQLTTPPGIVADSWMLTGLYTSNFATSGEAPNSYYTKYSLQEITIPAGPLNCVAVISPAIDAYGNMAVQVMEISSGVGSAPIYTVEVLNEWDGLIWKGEELSGPDFILTGMDLCDFRGSRLTVRITDGETSCESNLVINRSQDPYLTSAFGTTITEAADLDIPTAYIDTGLLVTYCGYIPDAEDHKPLVTVPCSSVIRSSSRAYEVQVQPDWIEVFHCNEASDTSEIIYRTWEVFNKENEAFTLTDTIVVLRLPALNASSFAGYAEDSVFCEITPQIKTGESQKQYSAWKQPVGLHDYEHPHAKLGGVVYEIPHTIIIAGVELAEAQGVAILDEYLKCVIVRKAGGGEVTIGDLVSGDYLSKQLTTASTEQLGYGFLHAIYELGESPVSILGGLFTFFPYLLLEQGDWVLSEGGNFEQVTADWFYNGNGNAPYWFTGGWPFISGGEEGVWYSDGHPDSESEICSVRVLLPALEAEGEACVEVCLDALNGHAHCGISIEYEDTQWTGQCPQTSGRDIVVKQTCWGTTENECVSDEYTATEGGDGFVVVEENITDKARTFRLSQWLSRVDTIGPIFDFYYPVTECGVMGEPGEMGPEGPPGPLALALPGASGYIESECGDLPWCANEITTSIRAGEQYASANAWERCHPTVYQVSSHDCAAEVFVPDVQLIDNCSGVHSVKAMIEVAGGTRSVALEQTGVEYRVLKNGDTVTVYTYSHLTNPIKLTFNGCDGPLTEVRYEAADHCWNQSEWYKYIRVIDDIPPTVIANRDINVSLTSETEWVEASRWLSGFDEGSWDNCAIDLKLARRSDWLACIDICPEADAHESHDNWIDILEDLGLNRKDVAQAAAGVSVGAAQTNSNYHPDDLAELLSGDEVEEYFFHQIVWLWEDGQACGRKVVHGWLFALAAYIAENCSDADEHGNTLDVRDLEFLFDHLFGQPGYGNEMALLGGGWAQDVPFKCTDACLPVLGSEVTAELLVLDACCNWSKAWSTVHVEDKSTARVAKVLADLDLTCEAYNTFYKDIIEGAAALGAKGSAQDSSGLFDLLDSAFGTYVWAQNPQTTLEGGLNPAAEKNFNFYNITCSEKSETIKIADTAHDGTIDWISQVVKTTLLDTSAISGLDGILDIVCSAQVVQDVWIDLDDCSNGTITRRFYVSGGCATTSADLVLEQVIRVSLACSLQESMFDLPANAGTSGAPVCLSQPLSGTYFPESLGSVTLRPHLLEVLCNSIAIGREVKELNVLGQMGLKKYEVTWTMKDWCEGAVGDLSYRQEVMAVIDPSCEGTNGVVSGTTNPHEVGTTNPVFREGFVLYQNRPNPFEGYTVIGFELPEDMEARLIIYDVTGKALQEIKGEYSMGYNEVHFVSDELPVTGILFYQLQTEKFSTIKRMIRGMD